MKLTEAHLLDTVDTLTVADIPKGSAVFLFLYTPKEGVTPAYKVNQMTPMQMFSLITVGRKTLEELEEQYYKMIAADFVTTVQDGEDDDEQL